MYTLIIICVFIFGTVLYPQMKNESIQTVGELIPNESPITFILPSDVEGIHILEGKWEIKYTRYIAFEFKPRISKRYRIELLSEQELLGLAILNSKLEVLDVGNPDESRSYRRWLTVDIKSENMYYILVGSRKVERSIEFRIFATSDLDAHLSIDLTRSVQTLELGQSYKGTLSSIDAMFEGRQADFFKLKDVRSYTGWIKISITTNEFDSYLRTLDRYDRVFVENDDRAINDYNAELILGPEHDKQLIVLTAYDYERLKENQTFDLPYQIKATQYSYNPRKGIVGWIETRFQNSIISFFLGFILSIILSYFFFYKSIRLKRICFEVENDSLIVDSSNNEMPLLKLYATDEAIRCASLYIVKIWHAGHARIPKEYVKSNLVLKLENITRLLRVFTVEKHGEWHEPKIINETQNEVQITFEVLDPKDFLILSAICEQDTPSIIRTIFRGEIAETSIQAKESLVDRLIDRPPKWLPQLLTAIFIPIFLLMLIFYQYIIYSSYYVILYLLAFVGIVTWLFLLFTRRGRRRLLASYRFLILQNPFLRISSLITLFREKSNDSRILLSKTKKSEGD